MKEVEIKNPEETVIEGWATKDFPGDDVLVHTNEPSKWKYHPEFKDSYWVSRGKTYSFPDSLFPNLTSEESQKVRITITPIK